MIAASNLKSVAGGSGYNLEQQSRCSIGTLPAARRPVLGVANFCKFSDSMTSARAHTVYRFGPFQLEIGEHRILRDGAPIALTAVSAAMMWPTPVPSVGPIAPANGDVD